MTTIECFVDPACPFAWATSRWLLDVTARRGVPVEWRQMSLAVLNEGREMEGAHAQRMVTSRRAGRLLAAVAATGESVGGIYTALGRRLHCDGRELSTEVAIEALAECGYDTDLAAALDDESFDAAVATAHQRSQDTLGSVGGSPITVIDERAFFGPVLTEVPAGEDADRLFDGLVAVADTAAFAQLERPRVGPPVLAGACY